MMVCEARQRNSSSQGREFCHGTIARVRIERGGTGTGGAHSFAIGLHSFVISLRVLYHWSDVSFRRSEKRRRDGGGRGEGGEAYITKGMTIDQWIGGRMTGLTRRLFFIPMDHELLYYWRVQDKAYLAPDLLW